MDYLAYLKNISKHTIHEMVVIQKELKRINLLFCTQCHSYAQYNYILLLCHIGVCEGVLQKENQTVTTTIIIIIIIDYYNILL